MYRHMAILLFNSLVPYYFITLSRIYQGTFLYAGYPAENGNQLDVETIVEFSACSDCSQADAQWGVFSCLTQAFNEGYIAGVEATKHAKG